MRLAFVYGSTAAGTERPGSDVDLMILGTASFADLARVLAGAQPILRREVNPTVMTEREFARRLAEGDGFARSIAKGSRLWLKGDENDFAKLVAHRQAQRARSDSG